MGEKLSTLKERITSLNNSSLTIGIIVISVLSFQAFQYLEKHGKNLPKIIFAERALNFLDS